MTKANRRLPTITKVLGRLGAIAMIAATAACAVDATDESTIVEDAVSENNEPLKIAMSDPAMGTKVPFIRGDANGDGVVDLTDFSVLVGALHGGINAEAYTGCSDHADVNDDGVFDVTDLKVFSAFMFNKKELPANWKEPDRLPAPFDAPGYDPTVPGNYDAEWCGDDSAVCETDADCTAAGFACTAVKGFRGIGKCDTAFVRGDANADGKVDRIDRVIILGYLYGTHWGQYLRCKDGADANDDGEITIDDYNLLSYMPGSQPGPFPEAGGDPTPDELGCED